LEENDKHTLEGLLKARSQDMRQGRRSRTRRPVSDAPAVTAGAPDERQEAPGSGRSCAECGGEISPRRLRAMPRAIRCLGCQRAAEAAGAHS
jgi:RNA polymerase-binding transcription factor DksA